VNPSEFRRISIIIVLVLWIAGLCLFLRTKNTGEHNKKKTVLFKVKAFCTSRAVAEKSLGEAKKMRFKGNVQKVTRKTRKFMGYIVIQDFSTRTTEKKVQDIIDFLGSHGFKTRVISDSPGKKVTIRVGNYYPDAEKAQKLADKVYESSGVSFDVRKYFKNVSYKTFLVSVPGIREKEKANKLSRKFQILTSDVETVMY